MVSCPWWSGLIQARIEVLVSSLDLVEQPGLIAKKETQMPVRSDPGLKWFSFCPSQKLLYSENVSVGRENLLVLVLGDRLRGLKPQGLRSRGSPGQKHHSGISSWRLTVCGFNYQ